MKLLVDADSLEASPRMLAAAWGLSQRGHAVSWLGTPLPAGAVREAQGAPGFVTHAGGAGRTDVVLGGAQGVLRVATAAGLASAHAAILDAPPGSIDRWGFLERAAWGTQVGLAFVEPDMRTGDSYLYIGTPDDIESLRRSDPAAATAWRAKQRQLFVALAEPGTQVVGLNRDYSYVLALAGSPGGSGKLPGARL